ncbi:hypothetical protein AAFF_G00011600 [Aldrovandia affinis]|uniref:Ankyrin repeat domain-containing protein 40 n=1 Tax=Aldrovandia affinis TaxID=143900 RepID=A0AAD7VY93_9TELE|nr:hypothetical protein AAFF_G00011600 [Aldrovandia affinis]
MSTPSVDTELQERLREASAIGDIDEVRNLVESGVNVNSQNEINGWTCLHWACKRNHQHIVAYLLNSGADKDILTSKDELAAQLTSKPHIRTLLGVEEDGVPEAKGPDLPGVASYLSGPPFLFGEIDADLVALEPGDHAPHHPPLLLFLLLLLLLGPEPAGGREAGVPVAEQNGGTQAFQPFFFTSTFPVNVQELVLKVRIQSLNGRENDFIEVELDRRELTYRALLRVCCRELDVSADHVDKIRKLPNTVLRKDKDVARLQDFQELEVVVEKAEGLLLHTTDFPPSLLPGWDGGATHRPVFGMRARVWPFLRPPPLTGVTGMRRAGQSSLHPRQHTPPTRQNEPSPRHPGDTRPPLPPSCASGETPDVFLPH